VSKLFDPIKIGTLSLRNRLMRSATAERLADPESGAPLPALGDMYLDLARGGIGLIVTGHAYVERTGKAHPEMASLANDALIPAWGEVIRPAQHAGARVMVQINHCGASCDPSVTPNPLSPSGIATSERATPSAMTQAEIERAIEAFGQAARRAREAGFDGVQIHGAHGYLNTQFLSPYTNRRDDAWGGEGADRHAFLIAVTRAVRRQVGADYPVWIKLGVAGSAESGLTLALGAAAARTCAAHGIDCIEISNGLGIPGWVDKKADAPYRPMAESVRAAVPHDYPLALVNGLSTRAEMEALLEDELVQMVSVCRPLIAEPDLPRKLRTIAGYEAACTRCDQCWPKNAGAGVACHNAAVQRRLHDLART
jgi:2,4-dienoyl-CoA reductase-like NADH-dependent reductase (Old Yellow Enzyme family)